MNRPKLRQLRASDAAAAGLAVAILVTLLASAGWFAAPETWFTDLRTWLCQWGRPAPTDRLVHIDLDDSAILPSNLGRWPWPRADQAALLNELAEAHPKAVALDIIYDQAQAPELRQPAGPGTPTETVDHDQLFEDALRRLGCAIVPYSHPETRDVDAPAGRYAPALGRMVTTRPTIDPDDAVADLGLADAHERARATREFTEARADAIRDLVAAILAREDLPLPALVDRISSHHPMESTDPVAILVTEGWRRHAAMAAISRSRFPAPAPLVARLDGRVPAIISLPRFVDAGAASAFVTFNPAGDGKVRQVPLVMSLGGQAAPSLGLQLALLTLDVPLASCRLEPECLVIPRGGDRGGEIRVPVRAQKLDVTDRPVAGVLDLAWVGSARPDAWQNMYPRSPNLSIVKLWQPIQYTRRIVANNAALRGACLTIADVMSNGGDLEKRAYDPADPAAWTATYASITADLKRQAGPDALVELARGDDPGEPPAMPRLDAAGNPDRADPRSTPYRAWLTARRNFLQAEAIKAAPALVAELDKLGPRRLTARNELRQAIEGHAVLIGWTATGLTDFVPTPLHPHAAGVRVHGMVFNDIITRNFLRYAPGWLNLAITLALGLAMAAVVARASPVVSTLLAGGAAAGYTAVNAWLFGPHGYVLALAAPLGATALTWALGSGVRFAIEQIERRRIIKRFATYVDPQLVNYLLANPDRARLAGERREMTVCFTDLAGFTSLSERLGEKTVDLLNEYFSRMFPIIRAHHGHLNKLLGDGMMFFFNALEPNPAHAADALETVLDLQAEMVRFNAELVGRGLPTVKMRVGITAGHMIVGDAGGETFSDFTVLGDIVNLASRLEGANKASGTLIICNAQAAQLAGERFLTRPIGLLQVVGKTEGVEAFEVCCRRDEATPEQLAQAERATRMVDCFRHGKLDACAELARGVQPESLAKLYLRLCGELAASGLPEHFDGTVVLESK